MAQPGGLLRPLRGGLEERKTEPKDSQTNPV